MANQIRPIMKRLDVTYEQLAGETGFSAGYLQRMATGGRNVSLANLDKIAKGLSALRDVRIGVEDLVSENQQVAVAGRVGAGQEVIPFDAHVVGEGLYKVSLPASLGTVVAVEVEGDSMWPRYDPGEIVAYGAHEGPQDLIGQDCVVRLTDGRMYLKKLRRGSRAGRYNLESLKGGPILEDIELEWAAGVKWPERSPGTRLRVFTSK